MSHIPEGDRMQSRILCIDDMVGTDSMVRIIDRFMDIVDLDELGFANTVPATRGRSSYSPLTLAKLYLFCYEEGIRASRRIEKACHVNVEVMWLVGGLAPDFKTIADFRRDNKEALVGLFYEFTSFAESAGLFGKKLVAIDGTKIRASNSKKRNISKKSLKRRSEHHKTKAEQFLRQMDEADDIMVAKGLADKAQASQKCVDEAEGLLAEMDLEKISEISLTDSDARCMGKGRQGMHVAYNVQAAVDAECHLIAEFDVTNRADDHGQLSNMALLTQETMRKNDITYLSDKGYYGAKDLQACKEAHIDCIVAPQAKTIATFAPGYCIDNFTYDATTDSYRCPEGACLSCKSKPESKKWVYSNRQACLACKKAAECTSKGLSYRKITRRPENEILDWADARYLANIELYAYRQQIVEHPFGTVKHAMGGGYFLVRGFEKVRCETALLFTGYNLKRALNVLGFDKMMALMNEYAALISARSSRSPLVAVLSALKHAAIEAFFGAMAKILPTRPESRCAS